MGIAKGDREQHIATPGGIANARDVASLGRQAQEPSVDFPVAGRLDGMCQRLQPQPLPPVVFTQGLWHGYGNSQAKPAWQPQLIHGIFTIAIRLIFFGKARTQQRPSLLITRYIQHIRLFNTTDTKRPALFV
ncbi:hypothetical protein EN852_011720 [Mesorhizobium sp. M2E.F.Ca.ET.209.01.1.1]|uniref:hypothetical protein n=1 Tax=Mesorhizobium sp. M2E.F.Ca.ET.209.01.1.1 TaxID=2500526 RepID=UPI000FDBAA49|nr:hypothetical protein [Mesorhizobium sp. M2E.F.Ca.ET.209.01.1.1]TGS14958.1 hypothetical protein EN852_011720 [Mesorhizobium sp. M2E.F.Ca.ET.209.01.1.1]